MTPPTIEIIWIAFASTTGHPPEAAVAVDCAVISEATTAWLNQAILPKTIHKKSQNRGRRLN